MSRGMPLAVAEHISKLLWEPQIPEGYVVGLGRKIPHPRVSHLYKGAPRDPGLPMCRHGWNTGLGTSYSIWRGNYGRDGICEICMDRAKRGLPGVRAKK